MTNIPLVTKMSVGGSKTDTNNYWVCQNLKRVSWEMFKMEFKFSKLVLCLCVFVPTKWLAAQSAANALRN